MVPKGKSINVTLIFSLERYAEVAEAYIRGLERLVQGGGDSGSVASVASFFVSRVDTGADRRLDEIGGHDELKGKACDRKRQARLPALQRDVRGRALGTMPEETIRAFQDHGTVAPTLERGVDEANYVFESLVQVGVDYDDVVATLEREGVRSSSLRTTNY